MGIRRRRKLCVHSHEDCLKIKTEEEETGPGWEKVEWKHCHEDWLRMRNKEERVHSHNYCLKVMRWRKKRERENDCRGRDKKRVLLKKVINLYLHKDHYYLIQHHQKDLHHQTRRPVTNDLEFDDVWSLINYEHDIMISLAGPYIISVSYKYIWTEKCHNRHSVTWLFIWVFSTFERSQVLEDKCSTFCSTYLTLTLHMAGCPYGISAIEGETSLKSQCDRYACPFFWHQISWCGMAHVTGGKIFLSPTWIYHR